VWNEKMGKHKNSSAIKLNGDVYKMNNKVKSDLCGLFSKNILPFVSLFFIVALFSSFCISEVNGVWVTIDVKVRTETELRSAIDSSDSVSGCAIYLLETIVLEAPLEIPDGKGIVLITYEQDNPLDLCSSVSLVGVDGMDTIIVRSGGSLKLYGGLVVTHAEGDSGRGVYVECGGTLYLCGGVISGNSADKGGGVYNEGYFELVAEGGGWRSEISGNTAIKGGGLYNVGTLNEYFKSEVIFSNVATSGVGDDVFIDSTDDGQFYTLAIAGAVVVVFVVVIGLLFYRSKSRKQEVV
jgi:hypothetical protein